MANGIAIMTAKPKRKNGIEINFFLKAMNDKKIKHIAISRNAENKIKS